MPIAPGVLPAPLRTRRTRVSSLLFHLRARDLSLVPLTGQTPTFSRASAGGGVLDRNGRGSIPVHSQPRWAVEAGEVGLLIETARTNICTQSDNLSGWTAIGTPLVVGGKSDPYGGTGAYLVTDDDSGGAAAEIIFRGVTFTGDGTKSFSVWVKADSSVSGIVQLQDTNTATNRGSITITNTAGVLSFAASSGTLLKVTTGADGWFRLDVQCPGVVAANNNQIKLRPTTTTPSATGGMYFFRACAYDAAYPGSDIVTAGSTVARSGDRLTYPCNLGALTADTDDLTIYARFARPNHADASGDIVEFPGIFSVGNANPDLRMYFNATTRQILAEIRDAAPLAATAIANIPLPAATNPILEVVAQFKDLAVAPAAAIDVGAGLTAFVTNGLAPIASFAGSIYGVGEINGAQKLGAPLFDLKVAPGLLSMDQMREAF